MHIVTSNDKDFSALLHAWRNALEVGAFKKNGKLQLVKASQNFVMITEGGASPKKIAFRPARSHAEAVSAALNLLQAS